MLLVTGGAGFIGTNFVLSTLARTGEPLVTLDKLTYAGRRENLAPLDADPRHRFVQGDICNRGLLRALLAEHRPRGIVHFAAESHVDRSISGPGEFIQTNIVGTFALLEEARAFHASLEDGARDAFRFLHVSTDEVYGSLEPGAAPFAETHPYAPNSPYAASKAGSDHLVRAYHHTYGLPVLTTNCSNNYGPYQVPEKLIPLMITHAMSGKSLPVYGDGLNVRDWLYVEDHCDAIRLVLEKGRPGETYNIGGASERNNLQVVRAICDALESVKPCRSGRYQDLVTFVADRPGHDRRYAIDYTKLRRELGWSPRETFESGLKRTVQWYVDRAAA